MNRPNDAPLSTREAINTPNPGAVAAIAWLATNAAIAASSTCLRSLRANTAASSGAAIAKATALSLDGSVRASVPAEIRLLPGRAEFYDFDAKYLDDACEFDIPAKLDDAVAERVQELAVDAFRALDCHGLARVDFFVPTTARCWATRST
jgi:D-alanine-D-alanine ligase